jgi:integrase
MRGSLRRRGLDAWELRVFVGTEPASGKKLYKYHTLHGTKKEAEREQNRIVREIETGSYVEPSRETVGQFLERWLRDYVEVTISRPSTRRSYKMITERHVIPELGHLSLQRLTPVLVQQYYAEQLKNGRVDAQGKKLGRPLARNTVAHHHAVLHEALDHAVKWGLVGRNVTDAVDPPTIKRVEMKTWTPEQAKQFLAVSESTRYYAALLLALTTGMRAGELFGLRWQDVDFDAGTLAIRQTLEKSGPNPRFGTPKTAKSRRVVSISPQVVEAMRKQKVKQNEERLALGTAWYDFELCFTVFDGKPLRTGNFRRDVFDPTIKKAGVPRIRFHDMRHSCATLLLGAGVHPKVVSERLGHAGMGITLDTYSHVLPTMQREAANMLELKLLGNA